MPHDLRRTVETNLTRMGFTRFIADRLVNHVAGSEASFAALRGFDYLAKVITGVRFKDGIEATTPDQIAA